MMEPEQLFHQLNHLSPTLRPYNPLSPNVRPFNPLSPTTRQTTRALQEIQYQRALSATPTTPSGHLRPTDITGHITNHNHSLLSPNPSPDEMVIQARGRRQVPLTFSPDINSPIRQANTQGVCLSPSRHYNRLMLPSHHIRTSPRKRLQLSDTPPSMPGITPFYSPSPDKLKISPLAKKMRCENTCNLEPETAWKALSKQQMEGLLEKLMLNHPGLRQEIRSLIPTPDLSPMEEKLSFLKKNIYKALPNTRLESKTDSMAYNRASVHLLTFKKALVEGVRVLSESLQWLSLVDYTVMAWSYVKATPVWDNPPHNNIRKTCFKTLANGLMKALKEANFSREQCISIKTKLEKLKGESGSDEILVCLKFIDFYLNNGPSE